MKKITAILSALALTLALCSCDKKKSDSEPPEVEEVTTEAVTEEDDEPVYRELTDEDFSRIEMKLNTLDSPPPVELNCTDLSGVDFGKRMSPCKAEDVRDDYGNRSYSGDPEIQAQIEANYKKICETPSEGRIAEIAVLGDKFYFGVNYDDYDSLHDSALFRFDPVTLEYEEINSRSGLDIGGCYSGLTAIGDKLYFHDNHNKAFDSYVYSIVPETGEITEFAHVDFTINHIFGDGDRMGVFGLKQKEDRNGYESLRKFYNVKTGEELTQDEYSDMAQYTEEETMHMVYCDGEPCVISGGYYYESDTHSPVTVKTQYYTLNTDFQQYNTVNVWKDRVCIITNEGLSYGGSETRLYTYDLKKMERTMVKLNGFNGWYAKAGDGFFLTSNNSNWGKEEYRLYYYMPDIGTAFLLEKSEEMYNTQVIGTNNYIFVMKPRKNAEQYLYTGNIWSFPEKMYWFDKSE